MRYLTDIVSTGEVFCLRQAGRDSQCLNYIFWLPRDKFQKQGLVIHLWDSERLKGKLLSLLASFISLDIAELKRVGKEAK